MKNIETKKNKLGDIKEDKERVLVRSLYLNYVEQCKITEELKLIYSKGRKPNFPECVSEYIARLVCNATKCKKAGDIEYKTLRIEVKCFASLGPISFGHSEAWDVIVFINAIRPTKLKIIVYKISNTDEVWKNIMVNKNETFHKQCISKRRPRIKFKNLEEQLPKPIYVIEEDIMKILNGVSKIKIEI
jgi:hypothetical protein